LVQMMNVNNSGLRIELIDSEEGFLAIKDEWDALSETSINPSFYATYPFVYTVWQHFRSENDRLFILLVRRGVTLVGIAPFRIDSMKAGNICSLRVIRFIAEWGSGDKPTIVTKEKADVIWDRIFQFLEKEFTEWDGIRLIEQHENSPVLKQKFFENIWYSTKVVSDLTSFFVLIKGTWEEYFSQLGRETRKKWNKSRKKLFNLPEGIQVQCIGNPEGLPDALNRFIAIEQSGWKRNREFGVGGNEKKIRFYEELLKQLMPKNMAAFYFLTSGTIDIASVLIYKYKDKVYGAQITFRPVYAEYSPGVILNAEIIKMLFDTQYGEYDFLGIRGDGKNPFKKNWSTGSRQTNTIEVYKKSPRLFIYIMGRKVKIVQVKVVGMITDYTVSEHAQAGTTTSPILTVNPGN
jgi:hypothetical protein